MTTYSYHIFYFPFKWEIKGMEEKVFSEQINLDKIKYRTPSYWKRAQKPDDYTEQKQLYNEKNYYYKFVHTILYDEVDNPLGLMRHFERQEPQSLDVSYLIKVKDRVTPYRLKVDAININLYATGVGFLSFYLRNTDKSQSHPEDILSINQYGRRIMPPFFADIVKRDETSEYLSIEGLMSDNVYKETFEGYRTTDCWKPASFINRLIDDLSDNINFEPIIDDRMFVASWYKNNKLAKIFTNDADAYKTCTLSKENSSGELFSSFWYKFLFVDNKGCETCQNDEEKKKYLEKHTYLRWQKWSSLYGVSRYSFVYLTNHGVPPHLLESFQTIYARMVELILVQRASMLCFSGEITKVSSLSKARVDVISRRISSIYKEYIRFINQVYFREVTAQDQGMELYSLLQSCLDMENYIKDLDGEIEELHQYVSLREDRDRNVKAERLNNIATLFLPITIITGFFGMNTVSNVVCEDKSSIIIQVVLLCIGTLFALIVIYNKKDKL